jgi:hypothetical protein
LSDGLRAICRASATAASGDATPVRRMPGSMSTMIGSGRETSFTAAASASTLLGLSAQTLRSPIRW